MSERRKARRLDKVFPVFVSGDGGIAFGIARNISEGGLYVETHAPEPLGAKVRVTFAFPGSNAEISAEAEVRYTSTLNYGERDGRVRAVRGMGLKFLRFFPREQNEVLQGDPEALH
ncbi:MAG: pilus assembly protein PilZ [Deltaproteobacteria bacterium]|nr:MAG: pilus assembly protein PilZ [Deltaproteobacteria bacterium]